MTDSENNDNESASLVPKDHTVLPDAQMVAVLVAFQLTDIALLRRRIAAHRLSYSLGCRVVNSTEITERRSGPDDLTHRVRSPSATQSPRS